MKRLLLSVIFGCVCGFANADAPVIAGKGFCLPATPTVPVQGILYVPLYVVSMSGVPVTQMQETDGGGFYLTTLTYSGSNLVSTSCPIRYTTRQ